MKIKKRLKGAIYGWKHGIERDELTGLFTRNFLEKEIWPTEVARAERYQRPLSLVLIDMDGLKQINDSKGHATGDRALRALVAVILRSIRKMDILFRYGGDEFLLVLPETKSGRAKILMERLQKEVPKTITFSFGVAQWKKDSLQTLPALVDKADKRMYAQKTEKIA